MPTVLIGIDPGVKTGIGIFPDKEGFADTVPIHTALSIVESWVVKGFPIFVRVEDARQRKWFGKDSNSKLQGAGSVKRDCKIWEDFLQDLQEKYPGLVSFEMIHPVKGGTKLNSKIFKQITGIKGRTTEHARDAFMLIHGYKPRTPKTKIISQ